MTLQRQPTNLTNGDILDFNTAGYLGWSHFRFQVDHFWNIPISTARRPILGLEVKFIDIKRPVMG